MTALIGDLVVSRVGVLQSASELGEEKNGKGGLGHCGGHGKKTRQGTGGNDGNTASNVLSSQL